MLTCTEAPLGPHSGATLSPSLRLSPTMLTVQEVTQSFGSRTLFENVNVTFSAGRRYGLTGPNGAGKSTFMKFLAGDQVPMRGQVHRPERTSILRQDHFAYEEVPVLDVVMMGNKRLWAAMQEKDAILKACEEGADFTDEMGMRLGDLETVIAEEDGYTADIEAEMLLTGLGIPAAQHREQMAALPSGLKVRALLAQALFGRPDCLLLDEPTNNLDMDSVRWLEGFLQRYEGVLVCISHDRAFLNHVTTHIADIDYETIIVYTGNYDDMVLQKSQIRSRVESEAADRGKKIAQLQEFIQRFQAGSRASQVQSRRKEIQRLQPHDLKRSNIQRPYIRFDIGDKPSGKNVLRVHGVSKRFVEAGKPDFVLCDDLHFELVRGEKLAIVGKSGVGKSALVQLLLGEVQPDRGDVQWGHETRIGYLPQQHEDAMPKGKGLVLWEWLKSFDDRASREDVRSLLGRMLFSGEEAEKSIDVLSGGETVRALFAKMMLLRYNVLVFDDPTAHLDLESINALAEALEKFEGTAVFVTHDRNLVAEAATRVLAFGDSGIALYDRDHRAFNDLFLT